MTDLKRLLTFRIPNLLSIFHFYFVRKFDILCNFSGFTVSTFKICRLSLNLISRGHLLVGCSRRSSQYGPSIPGGRLLHPQSETALYYDGKDPFNMVRNTCTTFFRIKWHYMLPTECKNKYNLRTKCSVVWFLSWYVVNVSSASVLTS